MIDTADKFIIMAHRSAFSILGTGQAPCKEDGKVITFKSKEGADLYAQSLNENCGSTNVHYTVEPA